MEVFRIDITSWTASFRYPNLISGIQPTLEVPPLSTVLGLLNAAAGRYLQYRSLKIGYFFQYAAKEFDLETIYQISSTTKGRPSNIAKSNVMQREFLFDNKLSLYIADESLVGYLKNPHYNILLGRSNDLATVENIERVQLDKNSDANKIKGQIVPFNGRMLPGKIQALPKYFTDNIPRQNLGTEPFSVIDFKTKDIKSGLTAYRDSSQLKNGVDIYFHEIDTLGCE